MLQAACRSRQVAERAICTGRSARMPGAGALDLATRAIGLFGRADGSAAGCARRDGAYGAEAAVRREVLAQPLTNESRNNTNSLGGKPAASLRRDAPIAVAPFQAGGTRCRGACGHADTRRGGRRLIERLMRPRPAPEAHLRILRAAARRATQAPAHARAPHV